MKHYPATRGPVHFAGLERTPAPYTCRRLTAALVCVVFYGAGLFTGAILFGEILLTLHR